MNMLLFALYMGLGTFFMGFRDVLERKYIKSGIDNQVLLGFSWLLGGVLFVPLVFIFGAPQLSQGFWAALWATVLLNLVAQNLFIWAFTWAEASLVAPTLLLTPPFVLLSGFLVLGEVPSLWGIIGICITVCGLILLFSVSHEKRSPSFSNFYSLVFQDKGVLLGILGSLLFAVAFPFDKQATIHSSALFTVTLAHLFVGGLTVGGNIMRPRFRGHVLHSIRRWHRELFVISFLGMCGALLTFLALPFVLAAYAAGAKRLWSLWTVVLAGHFLKERDFGLRLFATLIMLAGIGVMLILG